MSTPNMSAGRYGRCGALLRVLRTLRVLRGVFPAIVVGVSTAAPGAQSLPDGPGADVAHARCLSCHEADLIVQQRLSRTGWEREIDKMVRWGAVLQPTERLSLLEYLSTRYAPTPATSHPSASGTPGEATYQRACLACHEQDLIEQQRLTRPGWVREVDKMIRWGAVVPDSEKDGLVDFLTTRYGR